MMSKLITTAGWIKYLVMISILMVSTNVLAANAKYQELFYPNGMPMIVGVDGVSRPMGYEFYYEDPLSNSNINIVLFSELRFTGRSDESEYITHNVIVAVTQDNDKVLSETNASIKNGVTDAYYTMGGTLNHFNVTATLQAEHLYLWGVIAGSGGEEQGTNYIYALDNAANALIPILELDKSFFYMQAGLGTYNYWRLYLYIADIDNDGKMEILTRKHSVIRVDSNNIYTDSWSDTINVYHYNDATSKYEPAGQISALPANAVELKTTSN